MSSIEMDLFERTRVQDPEFPSRWIGAYRIECGCCGEPASLPVNTASGALPPDLLRKKFQRLGWEIGNRRRGHVCPTCKSQRRALPPLAATPAQATYSAARKAAERAFVALAEASATQPQSPPPSQHAAIVAECRALVALADEAVRQLDDEIEATLVRAEAMKLQLKADVDALRKRLLI